MSAPRQTFGSIKATDIPRRVNLCIKPGDVRFRDLLNSVLERLMSHGFGALQIGRFCLYDSCISLPRQVAALEAVRGCDTTPMAGQWGDFMPWVGSDFLTNCSPLRFTYMGQVTTIREPCGAYPLRVFPQNSEDAGKTILFQGTDEAGKWIRSWDGTEYIEGERVVLSLPYTDTARKFATITGVIKDETIDRVLAYKVLTNGLVLIGNYEYDETLPAYLRYRITPYDALGSAGACFSPANCCTKSVEVLVTLAYQPVSHDTDFLPISNVSALRLGCMAQKAEEDGDFQTANVLWYGDGRNQRIGAVPLLNQELRTITGDRVDIRITPMGSARMSRVFAGFT